jgi:hypothetical protein
MYGAEFMEILRGEGLTVQEAITVMQDAQEFGDSYFESRKPVRRIKGFRYSYDVEAEQDFDGSWLFEYRTTK